MDEKQSKPKKRRKRRRVNVVGRLLAFLGVTLLCLVLTLLGFFGVAIKGPSPTLTGIFCNSLRETSAIRWIPNIYLSAEELEPYLLQRTENLETEQVNTSLSHIAPVREQTETGESVPMVELEDIAYGTCKGKLLTIHDPKLVILGTSDNFGVSPGLQLTDMVAKYKGIAGTNAGGFVDNNGRGNGGTPTGMVLVDGKIIYGSTDLRYNVIGLDYDGVLIVGTMTGQQALDKGMRWGVSFTTHDGIASSLIINGNIQTQNLGPGVNPRTAIGQCENGDLLLLVLDGRSSKTMGATLGDVVDIMKQRGAVTAGNLDGGSSSVMVWDGEIINDCASVTGPRSIPTGFIVLGEEAGNG